MVHFGNFFNVILVVTLFYRSKSRAVYGWIHTDTAEQTLKNSLFRIGAVHNQGTINSMIACVHDALESHDWATRKTAAETLICMGSSLGTQLTTFKSGTLLLLESCRFDKVKPVRDCVQDAIQTWKSLPGLDRQMASSTCSTPSANGSTESAFINNEKLPSVLKKKSAALTDKKVNARFFNKLESQNSGDWHIEVAVPRSFPSREADFNKEKDYNGQSKNNLNECKTVLKLEESSINHSSSMQKYEREDSSPNFAAEDVKDDAHTHETESSHALILRRESPDYRRSKMLDDSELSQNSQRKNMLNGSAHERSPAPSNSSDFESYQCDPISPNLKSPTADIMTNGQNNQMSLDETPKWLTVQRQLTQLEYQQANIMDLFQEFMGSSRNSMYALEARIKVLERVMEDIVDLGVPSPDCVDRYNNEKSNYFLPYQDDHYSTESNMSRNARVDGSSPGTSSVCRKVESDFMVNEPIYDSGSSSWHINGDSTARDGHWNENNSKIQCETLEDNTYRMETNLPSEPFHEEKDNETKRTLSNGRCRDSAMPNGGTKIQRACSVQENDDYTNQEQMASRRVWDRENIHAGALGNHRGSGEGPSARSVWRASKDEATLAAIRGAKEDDSELNSSSAMNKNRTVPEMSTMHAESLDKEKKMNEMIERPSNTSCCSSNVVQGVSNKVDQEGKRAYWKLWSRTMELVQSGNLECAYTEVLNSGDELMLVRLMNKTGPVLEKLSSNTANEMLQNVAILLRQHSFFDFSLPWVQQVADLVMDMGANNLDILSTVKNELIQSIQEASHMEIPNEWVGNSMNELCSILMDAWSAQGEIS
ncbi:hypothetical protein KP509_21G085000 [Ceratopteris richardii]|uniref:Uncharacterized protein n=1 Tax=Ceratopteris richardii TaxID=49495 RepID=A0A8T2SE45_CERRI|nr:hypothetical protein KP509_21G085000 [Ceratopteris richardii]